MKKVCPNCGSEDIENSSSFTTAIGLDYSYECKECGYKGKLFPEVEEDELEEYQKSLEKEPKKPIEIDKNLRKSQLGIGSFMVLLSLGSLAYAFQNPQGIWGVFLIVPGLKLVSEELGKI